MKPEFLRLYDQRVSGRLEGIWQWSTVSNSVIPPCLDYSSDYFGQPNEIPLPSTQLAEEAIYSVNLTMAFLCPKSVILKQHVASLLTSHLTSYLCSQEIESLLTTLLFHKTGMLVSF